MGTIVNEIVKTNIKGQLEGADIGGGICLAGSPGMGKTRSLETIAKDLNMNFLQVSIPEISTENLSGLPNFLDAPYMDEYSTVNHSNSQATKWTAPAIIENANRLANDPDKNGCLLLIDDLHRINMAVAPYLYGLLGERKLGSFKLDSKVAIVGAMNDSDEAGFSGIDSPIKDRIGILPITFDFDYWYNLIGKHLHFYISSFLKIHPSYVQEDESTMIEQFATPRSWTHLANEFELYDRSFIQDNASMIAKQKVSNAAALELSKHIAYVEAIDFTNKIKAKEDIDIDTLKAIDQILYAYIINYVVTIEDAIYVIKLINNNIKSSNFIGFICGELANKYDQMDKGKPMNDGIIAILEKFLMEDHDPSKYENSSKTELNKLAKVDFDDIGTLHEIASTFVH
jgi:MoxR-like ATPase